MLFIPQPLAVNHHLCNYSHTSYNYQSMKEKNRNEKVKLEDMFLKYHSPLSYHIIQH